ncbi:MAG: CRISPR-associated protein Csn1 [Muribaculaceae bacterium]|nr:CRISPR-associated protein Csn1 [Muribaculaceae bacterium]
MEQKTLGIDLGTNSIGWAVISRPENDESSISLLNYGVHIFQEGVARDKQNEMPAVQERTNARAARRHYARRRLHKIQLLKILVKKGFCPPISDEELENWRRHKIYPMNPEFLKWQRTDDNIFKNPYHDRHDALSRILDLSLESDRFILGRALYHLAQRRGFLSNRKDLSKESDGKVSEGINSLSAEIEDAGMKFPGEYFYRLYQNGEKIRDRYQHRILHVENEFYAMCEKQGLDETTVKELHKAIFYQRPLKSQKGTIGKCTFEKSRQRCAVSHPEFEEFRMLSFINNIKIRYVGSDEFRGLDRSEKEKILPLFFRKSKETFDFEDIAKKLAGKNNYCFRDEDPGKIQFNYQMTQSVAGCPVTSSLMTIFGNKPEEELRKRYRHADGKSDMEILSDVWHVLFSFDSDELLKKWAENNLSLNEEEQEKFIKIPIPQGYASLSLKAIRKITPFLKRGMRYDEAVFAANLPAVLDKWGERDEMEQERIIDNISDIIRNFKKTESVPDITTAIKSYLEDQPDYLFNRADRLYHPSRMETYPDAERNNKGELLLGSPRISAIRNPMAMRALFRLRHLVNTLLREGKINRDTRINIELSRMLNNANMRAAITRYERETEARKNRYRDEIKKYFLENQINSQPTENDILKYALWEEQKHVCLYTGKQINISDFIGDNPKFDIEHTIPRSLGGDDSQANKTLCDSQYNRSVKRNLLPSSLPDHEIIMERIKQHTDWFAEIDRLKNEIARKRTSGYMTKETKDKIIRDRNYKKLRLKYLLDKVSRFKMTEVPEGFTNRQGVDIGIIGKYACHYLRTVFQSENRQIFTVKGATTAEFRVMWGLQKDYEAKERDNHCHHTIDAIVIACIGRFQYQQWAEYKRALDEHTFLGKPKPHFPKPWTTFTEDVKRITDSLLVAHHTDDRRLCASKKILRKRGKIVRTPDGRPVYQQGDTARTQLHKETFYGAIERNGTVKYVIRKALGDLSEADISKIVDPAVRQAVEYAANLRGFKNLCSEPVYLNKEKGVEIKRVRIYADSVTQPLHLKKHRDISSKTYKQDYHVMNDSNYCMGIYEGFNNKGKSQRSFILVNNLDAIRKNLNREKILPLSDSNGFTLKHTLKPGLMVLFYEKSSKEIYTASERDLSRRLYIVTGLSILTSGKHKYGRFTFRHHQDSHSSSEISYKSGKWEIAEDLRIGIAMIHTQFRALVEGEDFTISPTGKITFLHPSI